MLLIALLHKFILFFCSSHKECNLSRTQLKTERTFFSPISPFSFMVGMHNIICHWALYVEKLCGLERQIVAAEPKFNLELFWIYNNLSIRVTQCKRRTFPPAKSPYRQEFIRAHKNLPLFSADEKFDGTYQTNVVVGSEGHCLFIPPGIFKVRLFQIVLTSAKTMTKTKTEKKTQRGTLALYPSRHF